MIPVSRRYAPWIVGMLLVTALPVGFHALGGRGPDDCANPEALLATFLIDPERIRPDRWLERWELHSDAVSQWSEARIELEDAGSLEMHLIRSFDPRSVYVRPIANLHGPLEPELQRTEWIERDGARLPIQWVYDYTGIDTRVVGYLFLYEGRPVNHPFGAHVRSALAQLVAGPRPLTLLLAAGTAPPKRLRVTEERAREWLVQAWNWYHAICAAGE
jgi:hypothetical protein